MCNNPSQGLTEMAAKKLKEAKVWLEGKIADENVTVDYLIAIANARFGLVTTAQFLYEHYCQQNGEQDTAASPKQVSKRS